MITQAGIPCEWTNDSQRFLLDNFDTIKRSPLHIYYSALPLCPSLSWLCKCYNTEFSREVKVVKGVPAGWGKCSRVVTLDGSECFSCWNNTIAVGSEDGDIIILDAVTGSQAATFSGHTEEVICLVFSSDGGSLVSGSRDKTVRLWDMQTGGIIRTFSGHTDQILSVSISADFAIISSGSDDRSIGLWNIDTGNCHSIIEQESTVNHVMFFPTDPQHLLSVCDGKVRRWNINSNQEGPTYDGYDVAFSPDGTQFAVCNRESVTVQNSSSGTTVTKLHMRNGPNLKNCCFSPDGKLVAVSDMNFIHIWDITSSDPHLIETIHGGSGYISTLLFSSPSSLISFAQYKFLKFWRVGSPLRNIAETDPEPTSLISARDRLIALQAKDGIIITNDMAVLRVWDTTTGLCKAFFQIPHKGCLIQDAKLINGRLISTWYEDNMINLWDAKEGKLLWTVNAHSPLHGIKISQDGSLIFCLSLESLQALSAETGKVLGQVEIMADNLPNYLTVDGLGVWVHYFDLGFQGWNFVISDAPLSSCLMYPHTSITSMVCCNGTHPYVGSRMMQLERLSFGFLKNMEVFLMCSGMNTT